MLLWVLKVQRFWTTNWPEIEKPEKVGLQEDYKELVIWKIKQLMKQYGNQESLKISWMGKIVKHVFFIFPTLPDLEEANERFQKSNSGHFDMKATLTHSIIAVYCSQFHNSFSKWRVCWMKFAGFFDQVFLASCLSSCVNRKQWFNFFIKV